MTPLDCGEASILTLMSGAIRSRTQMPPASTHLAATQRREDFGYFLVLLGVYSSRSPRSIGSSLRRPWILSIGSARSRMMSIVAEFKPKVGDMKTQRHGTKLFPRLLLREK